jgi:putative copper export protein
VTLDSTVIVALQGATRAAVYGSSMVVVGAAVFDTIVLRRAAGLSLAERSAARARAREIGYLAAVVLCLGYVARLYVQVIDSFLVFVPTVEMVRQLIFSTRAWGLGVLAQLIVSAGVLGLLTYVKVTRAAHPSVLVATALLAAVSVPLTGHAVAHGGPAAVAVQAAHVFAAGAWLGTLTVMWLVCSRMVSTDDLVSIVRAFSPAALASAALIAVAGTTALFIHVGTPRDLLFTRYGVVLLLKIAVFLTAAGVGYVNWRHLTPRLHQVGQRRLFSRTAAFEIALAVVAILLTAVLTNLPQPGDE